MGSLDDDNDVDFVAYCKIHSRTELGLFAGKHINRLFKLAGRKEPCLPGQFLSMDRWTVEDLAKEIEALKPSCIPPKTDTRGMLGTNLCEFWQNRVREMHGWSERYGCGTIEA